MSVDFSICSFLDYIVLRKNKFIEDETSMDKARPHIVLEILKNILWTVQLTTERHLNELTVGSNGSTPLNCINYCNKTYYVVNCSLQATKVTHYHEVKNKLDVDSRKALVDHIVQTSFAHHPNHCGVFKKCSRIPIAIDLSSGRRNFTEQLAVVVGAKVLSSFTIFTVCPIYDYKNSDNSLQIKYSDESNSTTLDYLGSPCQAMNDMWIDLSQVYTFRSGYMWKNSVTNLDVIADFDGEPRLLPSSTVSLIIRMKEQLLLKPFIAAKEEATDNDDFSDIDEFRGVLIDWNDNDERESHITEETDEEDIPTIITIEEFVQSIKQQSFSGCFVSH